MIIIFSTIYLCYVLHCHHLFHVDGFFILFISCWSGNFIPLVISCWWKIYPTNKSILMELLCVFLSLIIPWLWKSYVIVTNIYYILMNLNVNTTTYFMLMEFFFLVMILNYMPIIFCIISMMMDANINITCHNQIESRNTIVT